MQKSTFYEGEIQSLQLSQVVVLFDVSLFHLTQLTIPKVYLRPLSRKDHF